MPIELYKYKGMAQVMYKEPELIKTVDGQFPSGYDLMNPIIRMTGSELEGLFVKDGVNYLRLTNLLHNDYPGGNLRYETVASYFIVKWNILANDVIEVHLHLDVLSTYASEIGSMKVMLDRSSHRYNDREVDGIPVVEYMNDPEAYLVDDMYPFTSAERFTDHYFDFEFDGSEQAGTYILLTSQTGYEIVE